MGSQECVYVWLRKYNNLGTALASLISIVRGPLGIFLAGAIILNETLDAFGNEIITEVSKLSFGRSVLLESELKLVEKNGFSDKGGELFITPSQGLILTGIEWFGNEPYVSGLGEFLGTGGCLVFSDTCSPTEIFQIYTQSVAADAIRRHLSSQK